MAIRVRGTIVITRKGGRRGDFNIGDLSTEIGEFEVKDSLIEEFEPGKYTGEFIISWIEPDSFSWRGRVFVKVHATLAEMLIDEAEEGGMPPAPPPEPDPMEATAGAPSATAVEPPARPPDALDPDRKLFGPEIYALLLQRETIKLDPTTERQLFRQQRDRLKDLGYSFDAKPQTWVVRELAEA